jgi:hypothetical protein
MISHYFPRVQFQPAAQWPTSLAAVLIIASVLLPDIHISTQTQTFQQHFVGGGMYTACLYFYSRQLFGWRFHWAIELILLFACVSALGVANKLIEFALAQTGVANITTSDADWDLLANTMGGFVGYSLLELIVTLSQTKSSRR